MKKLAGIYCIILVLTSCIGYTWTGEEGTEKIILLPNTNLELKSDSVLLELLPIKDTYVTLYAGQQVAVAEVAVFPEEGIDSIQVKLVHNEEVQGWLPQRIVVPLFVSYDSISQFIAWVTQIPGYYSLFAIIFFAALCLYRRYYKKTMRLVFFNDINSIYPMLLCVLVAITSTLFTTLLFHSPDVWFQYLFNPTLSPFDVPPSLSAILICAWLILIIALAAIDDIFRQLTFGDIFFYLLGLLTTCIFCYVFFYYATQFYVGYIFLFGLVVLFFIRIKKLSWYNCGNCGMRMKSKGVCPHCGVVNR